MEDEAWAFDLSLYVHLTRCEWRQAAGGMKPTAVDMAVRRLDSRAAERRSVRARQRELLRLLDQKSGKWNPDP